MAVSDTLINTLFDGRYRVLRKLGSGGMADVYLAEDEELGRRIAIKILNERHASDEQFVERFRREAKNAAGLSHPNIVQIYDRGEAEGTYYIAMEYLEGRTLKETAARQPLPLREAIGYVREILAALRFAHRKGIVHRDIKPHNALIDADGRVKVTDFGIARAGAASQMTEAGSIIGTAQYLSPEQARGAPVDHRSDLYSLGIVLYELVTGAVPFTGDTPVEIAMKHLSTVPEPPSSRRPELPRALDQVVLRALAKDPEDRYSSAEEMDAELARVAEGLPVSTETAEAATAVLAGAGVTESTAATAIARAPVQPRTYPRATGYQYEPPPRRRRPFWPWLLALGLLVAAGFAGWFAFNTIEDQLESELVAVPDVRGLEIVLARNNLEERDLVPQVTREPNEEFPRGKVISQDPQPGDRVPRGNNVELVVSEGPPTTEVPDVRGRSATDAVSVLTQAGLEANVQRVPSREPEGTIVAQAPAAGKTVEIGSEVRINASSGPELIAVPPVIGEMYEDALATLQQAGFAVARSDVDNDAPRGTVVGQNPLGNTSQPKGARITLSVSKGPSTTQVPDVLGFEEGAARSTLENEGFQVRVRRREVSAPEDAEVVLDQFPPAGEEARAGSIVSITVGFFVEAEQGPPGE
jgi:beta-lactam-binding protein with PASTA domain/predicted Ser/Thr protein kinase